MVRSSNTHQKRQLRYICRQIATQKCHKQWHESVTSYRCSKVVIKLRDTRADDEIPE